MIFRRAKEQDSRSALRSCEVDGDKAFFHKWSVNDFAIIEYMDGSVELVHPERVRFTDH